MRVLILGGDGYLGWPTAMHLSSCGHTVAVVDNYLRRNLSRDLDAEPLFPVPNLHERARLWAQRSGKSIQVFLGDLKHWDVMADVFQHFIPDAVIHYAEQPAAPYSMMDRRAATLTLENNLLVTANLIFAVREYAPGAHIIKLGTMGEYGTPNIDIEEGWLEVEHKGRKERFLYPRQASSLYHTTKIMDTDLLWFYVRMWQLRVTDLMQGPVYGLVTQENQDDQQLFPFFSYDEIFGTVLNRFVVQAVAGYPLTVYGRGGQTRGYLNIKDTLQCVRLSLENPPPTGELRIFNQFVETFSVRELAELVQRAGARLGLAVTIQSLPNPRQELEDHYYQPVHTGLRELGLQPHFLTDDVLAEMLETVLRYRDQIHEHKFLRNVRWS
jgi:UDP-sulfoquinovose synthase